MSQYLMPTKVITGKNCLVDNAQLFKSYGSKAMLVTGRKSAKINGAQDDVVKALESVGITWCLYDKVMSNPTVACAYEGAEMAIDEGAQFIIAIGGGSPIDGAKAMALIAADPVDQAMLFDNSRHTRAMPVIAVPTTAGTGSEVTQYSILMNDVLETKSSLATPLLFPKIAFLDPKYMMTLPVTVTINTAIDALSHSVEGMLSIRANRISDALAKESIGLVMEVLLKIQRLLKIKGDVALTYEDRDKLLLASTLGGMVIAQTGTTAVHAMGYSLTYFKDIDHGRANGLLLGHFMKLIEKTKPSLTDRVIQAMNVDTIEVYMSLMDDLLLEKETLSEEEINQFSYKAIETPNIKNCLVMPSREDLANVFTKAFK